MKLTIFTLLAFCLIATCRSAEEEYDYEEEPVAAPVTPAPARPAGRLGLLSARGRAPVGRKPAPVLSTTAKPVEEVIEEEEGSEETIEESQEQEEVPTTTTEATKKLRGGVIRPFRSNEDLLAALKRRRAQIGSSHSRDTSVTQAPAEPVTSKSKSTSNGRSRSASINETPARSNRGRFGSSRGSKPVQEEVEETQQEEVQVKPKPFRRG